MGADTGAPDEIDPLEFTEVKVSTSGKSNARTTALKAHNQLVDDRRAVFADTLEFLSQRLDELDPALSERFDEYLSSRHDGPEGANRIVVIVDADDYTDEILGNLPEPPGCDPLVVDVVHVGDLAELIAAVWEEVPVTASDAP
jgi:hypothetical protein